VLRLTVNGETRELKDVVYRKKNDDIKFNGILFQTFFGGSTMDWACKTPEKASFRNVRIETKKA
jgi:hypothetical protein